MSGIKLTPRCHTTYEEVQRKHMHRYAIFKIDQKKGEIDLEKIGERSSTYDDFLRDLQQMDGAHPDCRYGLYDYEYQYNPDGAQSTKRDKLFLMCWCPDDGKVKTKMIYSSSFDTLKRSFVGVHKVIQANAQDECDQKYVEDILIATDRT